MNVVARRSLKSEAAPFLRLLHLSGTLEPLMIAYLVAVMAELILLMCQRHSLLINIK